MVPLHTVVTISTVLAPYVISRYNLSTTAPVNGQAAFGGSSGAAMAAVERLAAETLPEGYGFEWSCLSLQAAQPAGQEPLVFALAMLFASLFRVARYERWMLPLAISFWLRTDRRGGGEGWGVL